MIKLSDWRMIYTKIFRKVLAAYVDMCKTRIEKAVKAEGATSATWDSKTKLLTVSYDPSKTNLDSFGKKLAPVKHKVLSFEASELSCEQTILIDINYVQNKLGPVVKDEDLSRYIL